MRFMVIAGGTRSSIALSTLERRFLQGQSIDSFAASLSYRRLVWADGI